MKDNVDLQKTNSNWIPLSQSFFFLLRSKRLMALSFLLICLTFLLTWIGYEIAINFVDGLTHKFFFEKPTAQGFYGWVKIMGWEILHWLFLIISRVVSFYLAFLAAYSLSTPGYVFLSTAAEKKYEGEEFEKDLGFSIRGLLTDLLEGIKIASFGLIVTIAAIIANFIPIIGQIVVLLIYTYYSTLMFLDYPSSRRRWSLAQKIRWLYSHNKEAIRLGIIPAIISMVPVINIFFMALSFPLLTVHCTLNFVAIEKRK